jgi:hypothetical protein
MHAMTVRRLSDPPSKARRYLDGKQVTRTQWDAAHLWRDTYAYGSRMETRKDGSVIVREHHLIAVKVAP